MVLPSAFKSLIMLKNSIRIRVYARGGSSRIINCGADKSMEARLILFHAAGKVTGPPGFERQHPGFFQ